MKSMPDGTISSSVMVVTTDNDAKGVSPSILRAIQRRSDRPITASAVVQAGEVTKRCAIK